MKYSNQALNHSKNAFKRALQGIAQSALGRVYRAGSGVTKFLLITAITITAFICYLLIQATADPVIKTEATLKPIPVSAISAKHSTLAPEITVYGRIENPNTTTLVASTLAYVQDVYVNEGEIVKKGQLIAQLDTRDAEVLAMQAQAAMIDAQSALNRLEAQQESDNEILDSQQDLFALTQKKEARYEKLFAKGQLSITALEDLKQQRLSQEIALSAKRVAVANHEADLAAATAHLKRQVAASQQADLNLERLTIVAPFDGRITKLNAAIGRRVSQGEPVATLFNTDSQQVRISIPANTAEQVQAAIDSDNTAQAQLMYQGAWINLPILEVGSEVRKGRAGTDILLSIPKTLDVALGRAVEVRVQLPEADNVIAVPVQGIYGDEFIYTVNDGVLQALPVDMLGSRETANGKMEVLVSSADIADGMPIVVSSLSRASTGTKVEIISAETTTPAVVATTISTH